MRLSNIVSSFKAVVFDCDGVLTDTNMVKSECFAHLVKDEVASVRNQFLEFHRRNGGVNREEKFRYLCRQLLRLKEPDEAIDQYRFTFTQCLRKRLKTARLCEGTLELLSALEYADKDCFVVSAAEVTEVEWLLRKRGIDTYFKNIFGAPGTKSEHLLNNILDSYSSSDLIFLGDSLSDLSASSQFGIKHIHVSGYSLWSEGVEHCRRKGVPIVETLSELVIPQ